MRIRAFSLFIAAALLAVSAPAHAGDNVAADAAFRQGRALMKAGHYAAACAKFSLSERLDPEVGTLLNLGVCHEKLGKLATAWAELNDAGDRASRAGEARRARKIRALAGKLAGKLAKLEITVAGPRPAGLRVTRDGKDITVLVGTAVPVDPGTYKIVASAKGYQPWSRKVPITDNGTTVKVKIPALAKEAAPAAAGHTQPRRGGVVPSSSQEAKKSAQAGAKGLASAGVSRHAPVRDPGRVRRRVGIGLVAGGAASVLVGLGFGYRAMQKNKDYQNACPGGMCKTSNSPGIGYHSSAVMSANLANAFVGVGLAAAAVGAYLWKTAPSPEPESEPGNAVSFAPVLTPTLAGAAVSGRF